MMSRWLPALLALTAGACGYDEVVRPAPRGEDEGSGGAGGRLACGDFADAVPDETVVFRVENRTSGPLFVEVDCERLADRTLRGELPGIRFDLGPCDASCGSEQAPPEACGACPRYVLRLSPGEDFTDVWLGLGASLVEMPVECFHDEGDRPCEQVRIAPPGTYVVSLTAFTSCQDCECEDDGRCAGSTEGSSSLTATSTFAFPGDGEGPVAVLFDEPG